MEQQIPEWVDQLRAELEHHTYESLNGGFRKMMPHHVDALMEQLVPWVEQLLREQREGVS